MKLNPNQQVALWYLGFVGLSALLVLTALFIHSLPEAGRGMALTMLLLGIAFTFIAGVCRR
jgi:hypothetical protein